MKKTLPTPIYCPISDSDVAYSREIEYGVIVDYDDDDQVIGIEFLDDMLAVDLDRYLEMAKI